MADDVEDVLPRAVALSWGVAERPQRGPKRELSVERIVDTAIELADAEGLGAVSMSRIAGELGFTTMSLYRYVTSKDDVLALMQDAVCAVPIPPDETLAGGGDDHDWREGLRQWSMATIDVMREHPWFPDIPISGIPLMPNNLAVLDWGLREMRTLPLTDAEKMSTALLLSSGATLTVSHHALRENHRKKAIVWLAATLVLGVCFLFLQGFEYFHAYNELNLTLASGVYGSTFFLLTGFHGFHVFLGGTMLAVVLVRMIRGHFTADHHFAFEGAAWYWHFVDVVWLGLYVVVYWL